jgi:Zn-dependent metalloprotease
MHRRVLVVFTTTTLIVALMSGTALAAPGSAGASAGTGGSFALSGQAARDFRLPADMVEVRSWTDAKGRTTTRYQQVVDNASVLGAQITLTRDANGAIVTAIGAHYPELKAKNAAKLTKGNARAIAARQIGRAGLWRTTLRLDPSTATLFYEVQSLRAGSRPVRWIDAANGAVRKSFNAIAEGDGIGVKGDAKSVDSRPAGGGFELVSADGRRATFDAGNRAVRGTLMFDANDEWDFTKPNYKSPDQRPGVDAHYYADVVDDFYGATFGRDSIDDEGMQIISTVHFFNRYCNAFWNGIQMTYGDGDGGKTCLPLSGGLDVVGHELTHGVTEFTSNLIYEIRPRRPIGSSARTSSRPRTFSPDSATWRTRPRTMTRTTTRSGSLAPPTTASSTATPASPTTPITWR